MLDKKIDKILKMLKIKDVPVICLRDGLYLIGTKKLQLVQKGDFLNVEVTPGKFERFTSYIRKNREKIKEELTILSLKNNKLKL